MRRRKAIKRRSCKTTLRNRIPRKFSQKEKRRIPSKSQKYTHQRRIPFEAQQNQNIINTSYNYNAFRKSWNYERRLQGFQERNSRLDQ
jgi:hypothetical protein